MLSFRNDYSEGAHERILRLLAEISLEQNAGYGLDQHTKQAEAYIKNAMGSQEAEVHFLAGGTQANMLAISAFLRPYQAAVAVETGHIHVHETGAVEGSGHKVVTTPGVKGKMTAEALEKVLSLHQDEHMVQPKLVYLSNSTELGTVYTKRELSEISEVCKRNGLYLYLDGARLASALTSECNDMDLKDLAALCDAFYLGGTKNGALFGEAMVLIKEELKRDFRYMMKNRGAMLAKGFVVGAQFEALFQDGLYFALGAHANAMAGKLAKALTDLGYRMLVPQESNQLFVILTEQQEKKLAQKALFEVQERLPKQEAAVRFVTSWATREEAVDELIAVMKELS